MPGTRWDSIAVSWGSASRVFVNLTVASSPAYRCRSVTLVGAGGWWPDPLPTDLRSSLLICRSSSVGDGHGNPSDRMGSDPIGACGTTSTHHSPVRPSGRRTSTRGGHPVTNHRTIQPDARKVIVVHVAVAIDTWGIRLGDRSCAADSDGYQQLSPGPSLHGRVADRHRGHRQLRGGTQLAKVRRAGCTRCLEVNRGDRRTRRIAEVRHRGPRPTAARRSGLANRPPSRRPRTGRSR